MYMAKYPEIDLRTKRFKGRTQLLGRIQPSTLPSQWFHAPARLYAYQLYAYWNGHIEYIETTAYGV
jgi:hypothetical protein